MNMTYGKNGMALTESFEKCRLEPYKDSGGVWTNGWGNTHHVTPGLIITQDQADSDLLANVQDAVDCVNDSVTIGLTQDQFDATVDLVFNIGCGAFKSSTFLHKLNAGDLHGAADQFAVWNRIKGLPSRGLDNRRAAEDDLFNEDTKV
jgi:lysozyme